MDREEHAAGEDKLMELGRAVESSGEEIGVPASRQPVHSTDQPIRCPRLKMGGPPGLMGLALGPYLGF